MGSSAYVREILANGADGVHSTSPAWVLTFIRWNNRYLNLKEAKLTAEDKSYFLSTRDPLIVDSDCASVSVNYSKESHTPAMNAMLYPGDTNYLTAVAPGDFVFVNMLETESEATRVASLAKEGKPINGVSDGFKGFFKVQSVRRVLSVDPATGIKQLMFQISGFSFTEFNNTVYFNPFLLSQNEANNQFLFVSRISNIWEQYVSKKGVINVQNIIRLLIDSTIGFGFNKNATDKKGFSISQNTHFYMPDKVGKLLGQNEAKSAKDVYNYLFGIQSYVSTSSGNTTLAQGMNPKISKTIGRYYNTPIACQGSSFLKPEYWNQVPVWSILNQYTNAPINELFTTLRVAPDGSVMPTLVFRQSPFSSEKYKGTSTKFLNLPRWKISPDLLLDINIGRDEAARINFVQVFSTVPQATQETNQGYISQQIAQNNFQVDTLDVRRSGLKPYIITSNFDTVTTDKAAFLGSTWAKLLADAVIGGQLKLNGSVEVFGIVDPIAVGDNFELDGVVFHIEGLRHSCAIQPDGKKIFTTSLEISHGVDLRSSDGPKIFGQMDHTQIQDEILNDKQKFDGNLPGISSEMVRTSRPDSPEKNKENNKAFGSVPGAPPSKIQTNKTTTKAGKKKR